MKRVLSILAFVLIYGIPVTAMAGLDWEEQRISHTAPITDDHAEMSFAFTNTGQQPVTITSIRTSCGCTTATLDKKTYAPGESGEIVAIFAFGDRIGKQRKRVTVKTIEAGEDGKLIEEETALELRVTIPEAVKIRPRLVYWRQGEDLTAKTVRITIDHDQPIRVTEASADGGSVLVELRIIEEGKAYELTLTPILIENPSHHDVNTPSTQPVESRSVITIKTDFPEAAPRSYTVLARDLGQRAYHTSPSHTAAATQPATTQPASTQPAASQPTAEDAGTTPPQ